MKIIKINNKSNMNLDQSRELFQSLTKYAQGQLGFKRPPTLNLVSDGENQVKLLGKTAYYDPDNMSISIYVDGRHTKDILRSLAHELVHHTQNENGDLNVGGYSGEGYAQKNKDLRAMERDAYERGNMCFRDWEDSLKQSKPTIYNEWRTNTMSTKEWKNRELMENLSSKFGIKMNLGALKEAQEITNEEKHDEDKPKLSEEELEMVDCGDKGRVPKYACDGKGAKDLKEEEIGEDLDKLKGGLKDYMKKKMSKEDDEEKKEKEEMNESQLVEMIKKLIRKELKNNGNK